MNNDWLRKPKENLELNQKHQRESFRGYMKLKSEGRIFDGDILPESCKKRMNHNPYKDDWVEKKE